MKIIIVLAMVVMGVSCAGAESIGSAVEVKIRSDNGRILPLYNVASRYPKQKAYAEAVKGDNYSIIVRNRMHRRVGVVIAVDGRNIISGKKSWLRNTERMYILEPYGSGEFTGWRTGLERVNRFYFTDAADSYAAAFDDRSAMGVIAVAVYSEVQRCEEPPSVSADSFKSAERAAPSLQSRSESAGTGFGREEYSPVRIVEFEPESKAVETMFIKYEWRSSLCRKGIISCRMEGSERNRLWDDDRFAPPPPERW